MFTTTPCHLMDAPKTYCSQNCRPISLPKTIEQGVAAIEGILKKELLCRDDLTNINQIYERVDQLEKSAVKITDQNSNTILKKVIEKVKNLFCEKNFNASHLISLYYLQGFVGLPLHSAFAQKFATMEKNHQWIAKLAEQIPCCNSMAQFEEDISSLFRNAPVSQETAKILDLKKKKLQHYEWTKQQIAIRKLELAKNRKVTPQLHPTYLDELLDQGYLNLYDHLLKMSKLTDPDERLAALRKMRVTEIALVVLEAREAIIQKVIAAIPENQPNTLFFVGDSGSGKSTTLRFLLGDPMVVVDDYDYRSTLDTEGSIGKEKMASCTFLPNIARINNIIAIDFGGFNDTHGLWASLGMECALQMLDERYHPTILAFKPVIEAEDKGNSANQLGARLARLFGHGRCILALTKYIKDAGFQEIKKLKKKIKKLSKPTREEAKLAQKINKLANSTEIQTKKETLEKLRKKREKKLTQIGQRKQKRLALLKDKEKNLLTATGLETLIRFSNLEDTELLKSCLNTISNQKPARRTRPTYTLDAVVEKLLKERLENNLLQEIESEQEYYSEFNDVKKFEQSVLATSLTKTILSQSKPEIGQFLHLPEMRLSLVRDFDKMIVASCIEKIIKSVVANLNLNFVNQMVTLFGAKCDPQKIESAKASQLTVQRFILALVGKHPETSKQVEEEWEQLQIRYQAAIKEVTHQTTKKYELSAWTTACLALPAGIPLGIYTLYASLKKRAELDAADKTWVNCTIDEYKGELERAYHALIKLKELEITISKQDKLNASFNEVSLSLNSMESFMSSIQTRIEKIREIYGANDWDIRVAFLADKMESLFSRVKIFPSIQIYFLALLIYLENDSTIDFFHIKCSSKTQKTLKQISQQAENECLFFQDYHNSGYSFLLKRSIPTSEQGGEDPLRCFVKTLSENLATNLSKPSKYQYTSIQEYFFDCEVKLVKNAFDSDFFSEIADTEDYLNNLLIRLANSFTQALVNNFEQVLTVGLIQNAFKQVIGEFFYSAILHNVNFSEFSHLFSNKASIEQWFADFPAGRFGDREPYYEKRSFRNSFLYSIKLALENELNITAFSETFNQGLSTEFYLELLIEVIASIENDQNQTDLNVIIKHKQIILNLINHFINNKNIKHFLYLLISNYAFIELSNFKTHNIYSPNPKIQPSELNAPFNHIWKPMTEMAQNLDMDMSTPLTKALLGAVILKVKESSPNLL